MSTEHEHHDLEAKKAIAEDIRRYGYHLGVIEEDNYLPGFVYSIGLYKSFGHPEVICFGLPAEVMAEVVGGACELISKGERLIEGKLYAGYLEDYKVRFHEVKKEHYPDYLGYAAWYYGSFDFPVLQLVWPDKQQKFPWEDDFNPDWKLQQPLLDRNTDFKFYEERNLGVYTTRDALEGNPILYAYHDEEGDWQFHTSDHPNTEDGIIVCLEELTRLDPSLNQLFRLPYGKSAWRERQDEEWKYSEDAEGGEC